MIIDLIIIILVVSAFFRGREIGFLRQLFSTIGFFGGLLLGATLQTYTVKLVEGTVNRSLMTLTTTIGLAFLFLAIGELVGIILKHKLEPGRLNKVDITFGGILSAVSVLIAVWLSAAIINSLPLNELQDEVNKSHIAGQLSDRLPYAPSVIASIGHLIDPNGFPQVFTDGEPNPPSHINLPSSSELIGAVNKDRASVVKIVGQGCGGLVDGSGFVVGSDMVVTNAHVVAGIKQQYVIDQNGRHTATAIWFDPNLDLAILRVANLAGQPLELDDKEVTKGTAGAVLGYPGGGGFTANPASVLNQFMASGRNIYGTGDTERSVYEIASDVEPGNSGGPLVAADGRVIGVIFARSANHENVGYALTMNQVVNAIDKATARNTPVSTARCAE